MNKLIRAARMAIKVAIITFVLMILHAIVSLSVATGGTEAGIIYIFYLPPTIFALLLGGLFSSIAKRKNSSAYATLSLFFSIPVILLSLFFIVLGVINS